MADNKKTAKEEKEYEHFSFTDAPEVEESSYKLLPEGEAVFTVRELQKKRENHPTYGETLIAGVVMQVTALDGSSAQVTQNIPLVTAMGWKILQLATCLDLRKHGEGNKINPAWWGKMKGLDGRLVIEHHKDKKGRIWNQVAKFLAPGEEYTAPEKKAELEI